MRSQLLAFLVLMGCPQPKSGGDSAAQSDADADSDTDTDTDLRDIHPEDLPQGATPCREPEIVLVVATSDGDTITTSGRHGEERVRLIGIDTPEIDHGKGGEECYGPESADYTENALDGREVWLSFDTECLDVYDRTLAYVSTGLGEEGFYERQLLALGYAEAFEVDPNNAFADVFSADEATARAADVGRWGACGG